jgi:beta-phosphoglucomutase-like phosphatase (HAD superfamily)
LIFDILDAMSGLSGISVIFDLDGTLVDSEPNYYEASRRLLAEHGIAFTWQDNEQYVGISTWETLGIWQARYGITAPRAELLAELNHRYLELARTATRAYPEMRKFMELLAGEGVPMAVASGSSPEAIDAILAGTGLDAYLRTTVSADEVAHGKPAPDVFLEAARRGPPAARLRGPGGRRTGRGRGPRRRDALHRDPLRRGAGRRPRVRPCRSAPAGRPGGVHGPGGPRLAGAEPRLTGRHTPPAPRGEAS